MLFSLALRNLSRQRRRSALTLVATGVGVTMILLGQGLMGSFLDSMVDDVVDRRLGALVVRPHLPEGNAELLPLDPAVDLASITPILEGIRGVTGVSPRMRFAGLLGNGRSQTMVMVTGIDVPREAKVCPLRADEVIGGVGRFLGVDDAAGGVVGKDLGRGLSANPGTSVVLQAAGPTGSQNALDVNVVGVARGAGFMESKATMTVPLALAQNLLGMEGKATEIAVAIDHGANVDVVKAAIIAAVPAELEVVGWADILPFLRDTQVRMRVILSGIGVVLFAIAVFGVVNTMLMSVWERVREIGTLLALGLRRRQIVKLFLIEGALLGVFGGVGGAAIGVIALTIAGWHGVAFSPPGSAVALILHPHVSIGVTVIAVVLSALGAVLASAWPARQAAALDPVEALRA